MTELDQLQRFLFLNGNIRGVIVRLRDSYQAVRSRHPYPFTVQYQLGQALAAIPMLSSTIKSESSLILQIQTDGPLNLVVTQCRPTFKIRGLAKWEGEVATNPKEAFGKGNLVITITAPNNDRYQGVVDFQGSIASALETYFAQSEQLATCIILFANEQTAAGLLLQVIPDGKIETPTIAWDEAIQLAKTISSQELFELPNQTILKRLFHEHDLELFPAEKVEFQCSCTIEKMEGAVSMLSKEEMDELLHLHKAIAVTCEFCNYRYEFNASDIEKICKEKELQQQEKNKH